MTTEVAATAVGDAERVHTAVRAAGSSFYWPMRLLARPRRKAMFALYALCRLLDDIADGPDGRDRKLALLAAWRDEIDALFRGRPGHPVTRALAPAVATYGLDRGELDALIDGMETDARGPAVAPPLADLRIYCRRVAGSVGRLSIAIFGRTDAVAEDFALALGEALQLTNILRDIGEDARRDRLYLPVEVLEEAGIDVRDPAAVLTHPSLPAACDALAALAEARFADAETALRRGGSRRLWPARAMMATYRHLLQQLQREGWRRLDDPYRLTQRERAWAILRHWLTARP